MFEKDKVVRWILLISSVLGASFSQGNWAIGVTQDLKTGRVKIFNDEEKDSETRWLFSLWPIELDVRRLWTNFYRKENKFSSHSSDYQVEKNYRQIHLVIRANDLIKSICLLVLREVLSNSCKSINLFDDRKFHRIFHWQQASINLFSLNYLLGSAFRRNKENLNFIQWRKRVQID